MSSGRAYDGGTSLDTERGSANKDFLPDYWQQVYAPRASIIDRDAQFVAVVTIEPPPIVDAYV